MRKLYFVIFLIFLSSPTVARQEIRFSIYGYGNHVCGKYLQNINGEKGEIYKAIYREWREGYFTAAGTADMQTGSILKASDDGAAMDLWIENYCKQKPFTIYADAVMNLIMELSENVKKKKK
jgi:hypothetical protein